MENPLKKLEDVFEKLKKTHLFNFINTGDNTKISKGYAGKYRSQNVWTFEEIVQKYGSLAGMINALKSQGLQGVKIVFLKKNGNRYTQTDIDDVTLKLQATSSMSNANSHTETPTAQPAQTQPQPQPVHAPAPAPAPMPALAGPGGTIGLGFAQYMDYVKKESKLELVEKENRRLDDENTELKRKNNKLQLDLDDANSKCTLANDRLALEKEKIENNRKGWDESPLAQKLGDNFPQILEVLLSKGQTGAQPGLAGPQQEQLEGFAAASASQRQLASVIIKSQITDEMALSMYEIFKGVIDNPSLITTFKQFINQDTAA